MVSNELEAHICDSLLEKQTYLPDKKLIIELVIYHATFLTVNTENVRS